MELQIHGKNLELNEATRDYITRKVDRLSRHLPGITVATIELAKANTRAQDQRVVAQATLDIDGTVLRGEERGTDARSAVDAVIQVMDRRVERYKGKVYRSKQATKAGKNVSIRTLEAPPIPPEEGVADTEFVEAGDKLVRVKSFPIKPMTLDDAAFQMELLGHDFLLFLNSETDQHNLLYKRNDGDYGLIQPEPI